MCLHERSTFNLGAIQDLRGLGTDLIPSSIESNNRRPPPKDAVNSTLPFGEEPPAVQAGREINDNCNTTMTGWE
jgi:hypothetical protein